MSARDSARTPRLYGGRAAYWWVSRARWQYGARSIADTLWIHIVFQEIRPADIARLRSYLAAGARSDKRRVVAECARCWICPISCRRSPRNEEPLQSLLYHSSLSLSASLQTRYTRPWADGRRKRIDKLLYCSDDAVHFDASILK